MTPAAWKTHIGIVAFNHLRTLIPHPRDSHAALRDNQLAALLTQLAEIGWIAPDQGPTAITDTSVLWPGEVSSLTGEGLRRFYAAKGHKFFLLRVDQLLRAVSGPLMPRFQAILAAYQERCELDDVSPLPDFADLNVFVGGERENRLTGRNASQRLAALIMGLRA